MNLSKAILLACLIATPTMPMGIDIGSDNDSSIIIKNSAWGVKVEHMMGGSFRMIKDRIVCDGCTGIVRLSNGLMTKIIECKQGNCTQIQETQEDHYRPFIFKVVSKAADYTWNGIQQHPYLVGAALGAAGYLGCRIYKAKKR